MSQPHETIVTGSLPIAIYYAHPERLTPLFVELDRRDADISSAFSKLLCLAAIGLRQTPEESSCGDPDLVVRGGRMDLTDDVNEHGVLFQVHSLNLRALWTDSEHQALAVQSSAIQQAYHPDVGL